MLQLSVEKSGEITVVRCAGRIVHGREAESLRDAVVSALEARIIVLDLSELESIDAGGLAELILLHQWTQVHGTQLKLVNPSRFVYEMCTRTGLHRVLDISSFEHALFVLRSVNCDEGRLAAAAH
jgi:anti-anti-sigma factor